ncbi:MAG: hypothetical protein PHP86_10295 [Nevskiales bacterium]|nr:hypothetical protein [Nevskiales bacterium]
MDRLIDAATASFMLGGLSLNLASCDPRLQPSLARACGCDLDADGGRLSICVGRVQGAQVLGDIVAGAAVAAVFSEVVSHRTLQIKASSAVVRAPTRADHAAVDRYLERFATRLDAIGFTPRFVSALFSFDAGDFMVVEMRPEEIYSQTPGPGAGQRLQAAA